MNCVDPPTVKAKLPGATRKKRSGVSERGGALHMGMRETLEENLEECARLHGHMCPGQILGARMARLGCDYVGIDDPRGDDRKKLIVWVEIDRCMTDAICAVTGVRLGRRSLKFVDYGKVAATFLNTETGRAVRVVARDESRAEADALHPEIVSRRERQLRAYREASDSQLFTLVVVEVKYSEWDAPGPPRRRTQCMQCGEGINDGREVARGDGQVICRGCAAEPYYRLI